MGKSFFASSLKYFSNLKKQDLQIPATGKVTLSEMVREKHYLALISPRYYASTHARTLASDWLRVIT